jgi:hypothetical protein
MDWSHVAHDRSIDMSFYLFTTFLTMLSVVQYIWRRNGKYVEGDGSGLN